MYDSYYKQQQNIMFKAGVN